MKKKNLIKVMAGVCVICVFAASFAFFTDRTTQDASAIAGNIDLVWEDTSLKTGSNNEFAQDGAWDNALVEDGKIINPGDYFDLSYELTNNGNKSIDVRQRIVLTSTEALTADAAEYQLTIIGGEDDQAVVPTTPDEYTLVYDLKDIILDGSIEKEDDATASGAYTVRLDFAKAAKNAFMNSEVDINLYAAAKQHRNTETTDFPEFAEMANISTNQNWEDAPVVVTP